MAEATTSGRRRWALVLAIGVVAMLAATVAVLVARDDDDGGLGSPSGDDGVPAEVLSGPGTELPDGLEVAVGSSLIGPVVVDGTDEANTITSWEALVLVEDDPLTVWEAYAEQIAGRYPDTGIDPSQAPGCGSGNRDLDTGEVCSLEAHEAEQFVSLSLRSIPGDVTGHYLLNLRGDVRDDWQEDEDDDEIATGTTDVPDPYPARERPGVGGPLAPVTSADEGDDEEYVVVEGCELLAQYGAGSITGGFDVLLRVRPDADLDAVVAAYVDQADQFDDPSSEEREPVDVTEHEGTTVTEYSPPGGAGGYTGSLTVVDRPEGDDYILFGLSND